MAYYNLLLQGGQADDYLVATNADTDLGGSWGNDTLVGGSGDDFLAGDAIIYHAGTEGAGSPPSNPYIAGYDRLYGQAGSDRLFGGLLHDYVDGGAGADELFGGHGADTLSGGSGNDYLNGDWGNADYSHRTYTDVVMAGRGNDVILWDARDARTDGGSGTDQLDAWKDLDLTAVRNNKIQGIEIINMTMADRPQTLTLAARDLLDISSTRDTLKVFGDAGDSVDIVGLFQDLGVAGNFHRYKVGAGTVLVDTDVAVI
jgi:Ca2+-binding RTX toxin-like protein